MAKFIASSSIQYELPKSRISKEQYDKAVNKLAYEITLRKNEFLNLCSSKVKDYSNKIHINSFREVLDVFTSYLNDFEKSLIVHKYTVNDEYIDYTNIAEINASANFVYEDNFLSHLNKNTNAMQTTKIDVTPMTKLNAENNEENFLIKIARQIMKTAMLTAETTPYDYITKKLKSKDKDNDDKITIGEYNEFLTEFDINLSDLDLRFLFERNKIFKGRVDIPQIVSYITSYSQKNYALNAKTNFAYVEAEKSKDEKYFADLISNNKIILILKECIMIFGMRFLYEYFGKHIEYQDNQFHILAKWINAGIVSLGYEVGSQIEFSNFKLICVHKRCGVMLNDMDVNVNLEMLFDFIVNEFKMRNVIKRRKNEDIANKMAIEIIRKFNELFIKNVTANVKVNEQGEYNANINEFEFRKNFIKNFGFIDHEFFDVQIHKLSNVDFFADEYHEDDNESNAKTMNEFKIQKLKTKNYITLMYNITFISLIRNYLSLNIAIDSEDADVLTNISNKIYYKIFGEEKQDDNYDIRKTINLSNFGRALPKYLIEPKIREENEMKLSTKRTLYDKAPQIEIFANWNKDSLRINEMTQNDFASRNHSVLKISETEIKNANDNYMDKIKTLNEICVQYLRNKFNIEKLTFEKIKSLGICKILKNDLINAKVNIKTKIHFSQISNLFPSIYANNNEIGNFVNSICLTIKDQNANVQLSTLINKIEDILYEYLRHFHLCE